MGQDRVEWWAWLFIELKFRVLMWQYYLLTGITQNLRNMCITFAARERKHAGFTRVSQYSECEYYCLKKCTLPTFLYGGGKY
jgi:hypothetical protein